MDCIFVALLFFTTTLEVVDGQMCTIPQRSNANFISDTNVSRSPGQPVRSGRQVFMNCENGYRMEGNSQSSCTGTSFDKTFGNCIENNQGIQKPRGRCQINSGQGCELEQNHANGLLVNSTNSRPLRNGSCLKIGEQVKLICNERYELSNPFSNFAICRADGQFSSMTSICQLGTTTRATTMLDIETTEFYTDELPSTTTRTTIPSTKSAHDPSSRTITAQPPEKMTPSPCGAVSCDGIIIAVVIFGILVIIVIFLAAASSCFSNTAALRC